LLHKTIESAVQKHSNRVAKPFGLHCKTIQIMLQNYSNCMLQNHSNQIVCKTDSNRSIQIKSQNHSNHVAKPFDAQLIKYQLN